MPLLILAIASFLLFPLIVGLLYLANALEAREAVRVQAAASGKRGMALSLNEAFDPIFSVLWEAPIAALELAEPAGPAGIPAVRLRPIYRRAAARFPEIYDGYSFLEWLHFLEETRLIAWHGGNAVLTADGRAFLKYRFVTNAMAEA
jgi:hypothetical protein